MNQLLFYLLQVIAASGLLYGYYHFALRNKKFHHYNRFYLLMAALISTLIPFLNIPVYFSVQESEASVMLQTLHVISSPAYFVEETVSKSETSWFTFQNLLYLFYSIILAVFLIRILFSLNKIRSLIRKNTSERLDKIRFVNTDEPGTPFSFFRWLFWNRKIELHSEKGEQIFRHELFHIQQKHSWDIIFVELLTVIFWINPFFHLIKRELKAIHEFLADEFAIKENNNWQYAELLLMQALNTNHHLVNPFFHNQIKRRIAMITTSTKPSYQYLRKLMVFPVAAIIIFLFAFSYQNKRIDPHASDQILDIKRATADTSKQLQNALIIINGVVQEKRGFQNIDTTKLPQIEFLVSIRAFSGNEALEKYGESGKDGVIELFYNQFGNQIIDTVPKVDTIYWIKDLPPPAKKPPTQAQLKTWQDSKTYGVWLDGKRISNNELSKYQPSDFGLYYASKLTKNAVNYGKHYVQIDLYTHKYYEKVYINSTSRKPFLVREMITRSENSKRPAQPLIVINGYAMPGLTMEAVKRGSSEDSIVTMNILSEQYAVEKYGEKGRYGAIELTAKNWDNNVINMTIYKSDSTVRVTDKNLDDQITMIETYHLNLHDNKVFVKLEVEPSFPGGEREWRRYLEKNLDASLPGKNGCKSGSYTVMIQFIVDQTGNISDVRPLTKFGYGMEDQVMSLIKKGPKWIPGIQNGRNVRAYKSQPVTFVIGNGKPNNSKSITNKPGEKTIMNEVVVKSFENDENKVFEKVEVEAAFRGGEKEWRNYLNRNLDVNVPLKNGCKSGTYTVVVQFIVAKDGRVSDVRALTNYGFGMEEEAMRMIKKGPDWIPAIQNGHNVKAYRRQPFTFVIDNGKPNNSKSVTKVKSFENDENIVFEKVETEAAFPGGVKGWREFLQKNLKSTVPVDSGAKAGTYTVITQFIVHKDGSISDLKTFTNHGHGMESEVLRVMKESPNWVPAMQNGCNVTAYRKQPITFVIAEE